MPAGKSMLVLRSNHQLPRWNGRWVLTPRKPLDEPVRREVLARRRRMFLVLMAGTCLTVPAGILPGFGFLAWAGAAQAAALALFVVFLLSEKKKNASRPLHLPAPAPALYLVADPAPAGKDSRAAGGVRSPKRWHAHPAARELARRRA